MGRGRSFVTCHLLGLCLGREGDWYKAAGTRAESPHTPHAAPALSLILPPSRLLTTMTPGIRAPFFLLLLLASPKGERRKVGRGWAVQVSLSVEFAYWEMALCESQYVPEGKRLGKETEKR